MLDADDRDAICRVLTATWPETGVDQVERLLTLLAAEDAGAICGAIDAYCRSQRARWVPTAGDLLREITAAQVRDRQRIWQPATRRPMKRVEVPTMLQPCMHGLTHLDVRVVDCPHCGDSGIAQYWYDLQRPQRVYLDTEYADLPTETQDRLRWGKAICDCSRGADRPESEWTAQRWRHSWQTVHVYPRLEDLRRLVERRRTEAEQVGVSPQAA